MQKHSYAEKRSTIYQPYPPVRRCPNLRTYSRNHKNMSLSFFFIERSCEITDIYMYTIVVSLRYFQRDRKSKRKTQKTPHLAELIAILLNQGKTLFLILIFLEFPYERLIEIFYLYKQRFVTLPLCNVR